MELQGRKYQVLSKEGNICIRNCAYITSKTTHISNTNSHNLRSNYTQLTIPHQYSTVHQLGWFSYLSYLSYLVS